jgi:integrase
LTYSGNSGSKSGRQMPRKPSFKFTNTTSGWKVEIPERLSPTGKRQRVFFPTRDEAKKYAAELRSDYEAHGTKASVISPSLADEATRAAALLEPFGISLREAAQMVVDVKNAELSSSLMERALDIFLESKSSRSEAHAKSYGYMKRDLLESFTGRSLSSITAAELQEHTETHTTTGTSFNARARLIRAFWRWCAKHPRDWCDAKLVEILERKEVTRGEIGVLDVDQCQKLLNTAKDYYPECVPGLAISLFTGMRKSELGRLRASDITESGITLPAASTKTGRRRFIEMPPPLKVWLKTYPIGEIVLPTNWSKKEKAIRRLAGWKVWSDLVEPNAPAEDLPKWPHNALRHTHASVHVSLGKPIESLTFEFGHSGGTQVLKSHYVGVMPKAEAAKIMRIRP